MNDVLLCMPHDVRAIANWVLDLAEINGHALTNFSVNKIVFFLHSDFLVNFDRPLVLAKIEAWKHGPVFRELYSAFKQFEARPVTCRITRIDPLNGETKICTTSLDIYERDFLEKFCLKYASLSASTLYALSHQPGGPWDQVWNHQDDVNAFMRITDDAISRWWSRASRH